MENHEITMDEVMTKLNRLRDRIEELEEHDHCENCGTVIDVESDVCSEECGADVEGDGASLESNEEPTVPTQQTQIPQQNQFNQGNF